MRLAPLPASLTLLALLALTACGSDLEVDRTALDRPEEPPTATGGGPSPGEAAPPAPEPQPSPGPPPAAPPPSPAPTPSPTVPTVPPPTVPPPAVPPPTEPTPPPPTTPPPSSSDLPSVLQLDLDRAAGTPQLSRVRLDVSGIALYTGDPPPPEHGRPCDVSGAQWFDVTTRVQFDPSAAGRSNIARLETTSAGALTEIRIFLRGDVRRRNRDHNLDGRETCVAGDGFDVAVMRVRPAGAVPLAGADYRVAVGFDPDALVGEERITCPAAGAVTPQFHDPDGPDECRTSEDAGDDGDPTTRLRYVLAGEAICVAERQGT